MKGTEHYRINAMVSKFEQEHAAADAVKAREYYLKREVVSQLLEMLEYGKPYAIKIDKNIVSDDLSTKISIDLYLRDLQEAIE